MNSYPLQLKFAKESQNPDQLNSQLLDHFLSYIKEKRLELYPAQEEAILELFDGKNVILNTPTGSGKSLVATALHFNSLSQGRKSVYTSPIKALVNEKFFSLCKDFGPDQVGMITGDATVNPEAPILCCTAEILAIEALRKGSDSSFNDIVIDEFHYYSDRDRGVSWQIPLLTLKKSRFLLMSATFGDTEPFKKYLTDLTQNSTVVVESQDRPVPLSFEYSDLPLHEKVDRLITTGRYPIYLVNFSQRECAEQAQNFLSVDFCTKEEKKRITEMMEDFRFSSPYGKEFQKLLKHGIGIHHAGLLPKYRILVERLAQKGMLKIISGTDTLGVGVNVPIKTVLLTKLCKYDGEKTSILNVRDFKQICGRAGRKGFDDQGYVVAQAPEHVVENLKQEKKAEGDPKKLKKLVKKKPPEKGYIPWNKETFERLIQSPAEPLVSRFKVTHATLLNVLSRPDEKGCEAARDLIRHSHETPVSKRKHGKSAFQLFRSLVDRGIVELNPLRVNIDLQQEFSLNQALSLYLIDTLKLLDKESADYALDLLTLVESILENPDLILNRQLDKIKTLKMDELKAQGIEFDQRIEELEKLEYPKPNRDFIYSTFNEFSAAHPWVGQDNIRPKSIAREMVETYQSFSEYIREYRLQRTEGLLLRYLSNVYKTLVQTIPAQDRTDELDLIIAYFGTILREIDSSLLDEWEKLRDPNAASEKQEQANAADLRNQELAAKARRRKQIDVWIRNEVFRFVRAFSRGEYDDLTDTIKSVWNKDNLEPIWKAYLESGHTELRTDPRARHPKNTVIKQIDDTSFEIQQTLVDPEDHNDWVAQFKASESLGESPLSLHLELVSIGPIE